MPDDNFDLEAAGLPVPSSASSVDRSGPLRRLKAIDSANAAANAQSLHEQMFGEKSRMDIARLSLAQQKYLSDQSAQIERATLNRARYEDSIRRNIAAAAAIEQLSTVDHTSPTFDKQVASVVAQYPDALGSRSFLTILQDARNDRNLFQKAEATRAAATFNSPAVAKTFNDTLSQTGDIEVAKAAAKAAEDTFNKAKGLATNVADLSPQDRAVAMKVLQGGDLTSPDAQNQLLALELKATTAKNARDVGSANLKNVSVLSTALTHLQNASDVGNETPEMAAARQSGIKALSDYMGHLQQPTDGSNTSPVDAALDKYLGKAGTPAVTPEQSAGDVASAAPPDAAPTTSAATPPPEVNPDDPDALQ